ncbi:hypothetical protein LTR97_003899 [Elasticomyces elasticus]|uniref:Uncharacterized protein n=1 Tax=Elasticomyces elasticus TaxID=574655 RepID=A0AAN7W8L7_9PEZI|nr:hypothetical protein LTR97_003899 [Elasticomyces elasticus]
MAEQLVQTYLDRAQVAEQSVHQLKIQLSRSLEVIGMQRADRREFHKQLSEQKKKVAELEKVIEETKSQAPSNVAADLKMMLQSALKKVEELEGTAVPASSTTIKKESSKGSTAGGFTANNLEGPW